MLYQSLSLNHESPRNLSMTWFRPQLMSKMMRCPRLQMLLHQQHLQSSGRYLDQRSVRKVQDLHNVQLQHHFRTLQQMQLCRRHCLFQTLLLLVPQRHVKLLLQASAMLSPDNNRSPNHSSFNFLTPQRHTNHNSSGHRHHSHQLGIKG
jgi:hypothetical protein